MDNKEKDEMLNRFKESINDLKIKEKEIKKSIVEIQHMIELLEMEKAGQLNLEYSE